MSMAEVCCETVAAVGRGEGEKRAMGEARRRRRAGEVRRWKVAAVGEEAASLKRRFGGSEEGLVESRHGVASVAGRRREMEDAVSVRAAFAASPARGVGTEGEGYDFYGVFDGHGCSHVAEACRDRMHEVVAEELSAVELPSWGAVMERSFSRMDAEVMAGVSRGEGSKCRCEAPKCDHVGSTAVVAVVGGRRIVVANCGDSRAVLCRNGLPVPLSSDHKPDRPDELERIQEAGGRVIFWEGARVLGVLAMSRAIGDGYLKPYVVAEPEVTVTEREDGDECLILASDGLWDVVSNEAACEVASACLRRRGRERGCADAAALLAKLALARRSSDNVSVIVVNLRRPTAL